MSKPLTDINFGLNGNPKGPELPELMIKTPSQMAFVLFWSPSCGQCTGSKECRCQGISPTCGSCKGWLQTFHQIGQAAQQWGVDFYTANITAYPKITAMAYQTETKINYVPMHVLFYQGLPYSIFNREKRPDLIRDFLKWCLDETSRETTSNSREVIRDIRTPDRPATRVCAVGVPYNIYGPDDNYQTVGTIYGTK